MNYELQTKHGFTLMEMTVVIVVVALLASFALPAARMLFNSFQSQSGTKAVISAALSSARAIAAKHQHYAGVRFQNRYQEDNKGCQYMIFIVQDPEILAWGFRAVDGLEPIKLPDSVGVMDLNLGSTDPDQIIDADTRINESWEITDTTAFSIIFSPSGKLVIHDVQVRNRDGIPDSTGELDNPSADDVFNKKDEVDNGIGMFYQDDYANQDSDLRYSPQNFGFGKEPSRNSFIIYDRVEFDKVDVNTRWSDYLDKLERIYINAYTGTMIKR
jgi:prepilin-type N-terminal cleavage/methylation domain-containing protein